MLPYPAVETAGNNDAKPAVAGCEASAQSPQGDLCVFVAREFIRRVNLAMALLGKAG
jgi:hypothetical protein